MVQNHVTGTKSPVPRFSLGREKGAQYLQCPSFPKGHPQDWLLYSLCQKTEETWNMTDFSYLRWERREIAVWSRIHYKPSPWLNTASNRKLFSYSFSLVKEKIHCAHLEAAWGIDSSLLCFRSLMGPWHSPDTWELLKKRQVDCTITRLRGPLFLARLINVGLLQYKASSWRIKYVGSLPMCRHEHRKSRKNEVSPVNTPLPFTRKWHYKVALMKLRYMIYLRKGSFNCHKDAHSSLL